MDYIQQAVEVIYITIDILFYKQSQNDKLQDRQNLELVFYKAILINPLPHHQNYYSQIAKMLKSPSSILNSIQRMKTNLYNDKQQLRIIKNNLVYVDKGNKIQRVRAFQQQPPRLKQRSKSTFPQNCFKSKIYQNNDLDYQHFDRVCDKKSKLYQNKNNENIQNKQNKQNQSDNLMTGSCDNQKLKQSSASIKNDNQIPCFTFSKNNQNNTSSQNCQNILSSNQSNHQNRSRMNKSNKVYLKDTNHQEHKRQSLNLKHINQHYHHEIQNLKSQHKAQKEQIDKNHKLIYDQQTLDYQTKINQLTEYIGLLEQQIKNSSQQQVKNPTQIVETKLTANFSNTEKNCQQKDCQTDLTGHQFLANITNQQRPYKSIERSQTSNYQIQQHSQKSIISSQQNQQQRSSDNAEYNQFSNPFYSVNHYHPQSQNPFESIEFNKSTNNGNQVNHRLQSVVSIISNQNQHDKNKPFNQLKQKNQINGMSVNDKNLIRDIYQQYNLQRKYATNNNIDCSNAYSQALIHDNKLAQISNKGQKQLMPQAQRKKYEHIINCLLEENTKLQLKIQKIYNQYHSDKSNYTNRNKASFFKNHGINYKTVNSNPISESQPIESEKINDNSKVIAKYFSSNQYNNIPNNYLSNYPKQSNKSSHEQAHNYCSSRTQEQPTSRITSSNQYFTNRSSSINQNKSSRQSIIYKITNVMSTSLLRQRKISQSKISSKNPPLNIRQKQFRQMQMKSNQQKNQNKARNVRVKTEYPHETNQINDDNFNSQRIMSQRDQQRAIQNEQHIPVIGYTQKDTTFKFYVDQQSIQQQQGKINNGDRNINTKNKSILNKFNRNQKSINTNGENKRRQPKIFKQKQPILWQQQNQNQILNDEIKLRTIKQFKCFSKD